MRRILQTAFLVFVCALSAQAQGTVQIKRGPQASLPTLLAGEFAFTTDTHRLYIGQASGGNFLVTAAGAAGSQILVGTGVPGAGLGADGDLYLLSTSGDVYKKAGGAWGSPVANIKGPTGATGAAGVSGPNYPLKNGAGATLTSAPTSLTFGAGLSTTAAGSDVSVVSTGPPVGVGAQTPHMNAGGTAFVTDGTLQNDGVTVAIGQGIDNGSMLAITNSNNVGLTLTDDGSGNDLLDCYGNASFASAYLDTANFNTGNFNVINGNDANVGSINSTYLANYGDTGLGVNRNASAKVSVGGLTTTQNGINVTMPSGATGSGIALYNSAGTLVNAISGTGMAYGVGAAAVDLYSVAVGPSASAASIGTSGATAIGHSTSATNGTAIGNGCIASGGGTAIGSDAQATAASGNNFGVAIGTATHVSAGAVVIGYASSSTVNGTIVIGQQRSPTAEGQIILSAGTQNDVYLGGITSEIASIQPGSVQPVGGSGMNAGGPSMTVAGGKGTGSGAAGPVYIDTATVGGSGTTLNGLSHRAKFDGSGLTVLGGLNSSDGSAGLTTTVTLAKLTTGGTNGSMTFKNGILVAFTPPT